MHSSREDQPGTNRFTSSSTYRSRVISQPVAGQRDDAAEHEDEHRDVAPGRPEQDADEQRPRPGHEIAVALHERRQRRRRLGGAGPQPEQRQDHREAGHRDGEHGHPEPGRGAGRDPEAGEPDDVAGHEADQQRPLQPRPHGQRGHEGAQRDADDLVQPQQQTGGRGGQAGVAEVLRGPADDDVGLEALDAEEDHQRQPHPAVPEVAQPDGRMRRPRAPLASRYEQPRHRGEQRGDRPHPERPAPAVGPDRGRDRRGRDRRDGRPDRTSRVLYAPTSRPVRVGK